MEEREFLELADTELAKIEDALDMLQERIDADWDYELKPGGIIELDLEAGGKIIINRHTAAREIWIAARSGGFHFKPPSAHGQPWTDTRTGKDLAIVLSHCISDQTGGNVAVTW